MRSSAFERRALDLYAEMLVLPDEEREAWLLETCQDELLRAAVAALARSDAAAAAGLPTIPPEPQPVVDAPPPERIGGYRIASELGRGGMGVVYLGERDDGLFEQRVAVKLIRGAFVSEAVSEQFMRERRILARLRHPHIAQIIDGGVASNGAPYIVMELIAGAPIDAHCEAHRIPLAARLELFRQVAEAIAHAHRNLIVHADIKPGNVIVEDGFGVKLLDFGIARLLEDDEVSPRTGYTTDYASPERLAGSPARPADDIYALGVLLRELVDGWQDGKRDLLAIAAKAAANDLADRYGTVAELLVDLSRWQAHLPTAASSPGRVQRAYLAWRRHRIGYTVAAAALVALCVVIVVVSQLYLASERQRSLADKRFAETRQIADYLIDEVEPELARTAGALPLRRELVARSGDYLRALESDPATASVLQRDIASGYLGLARVYGLDPSGGLGDLAAAQRSLSHAQALLRGQLAQHPGDASLLGELVRADVIAGSAVFVMPDGAHLPPALAALHRAQSLLKRRIALFPDDTDARLALWRADIMVTRAHEYLGTSASVRSALRAELSNAAMPVATFRQRAERNFLLDASLLMLGEAYGTDDPATASDFHTRLIDQVNQMRRRGESDWQNEFLRSSALAERAGLSARRDTPAAIRDYQASLEGSRQLLWRDHNHEIAVYRAFVEYRLADLLARSQRFAQARAVLNDAVAWSRADAAVSPVAGTSRRLVALLLSERGLLETQAGRRDAACTADRQAMTVWKAMMLSRATLPDDFASGKPLIETRTRLVTRCEGPLSATGPDLPALRQPS